LHPLQLTEPVDLDRLRSIRRRTHDLDYHNRLKVVEKKALNPGYSLQQIADELMLDYTTVQNAIQLFETGGLEALEPGQVGRPEGTSSYPEEPFEDLCTEIDKQEGVWSGPRMRAYLLKHHQLAVPLSTIYDRMDKLNMSYKSGRPTPEKGDPDQQSQFKCVGLIDPIRSEFETPTIKSIKIFFADEMRYGLMTNRRRSWSRVGQRAVIPTQREFTNGYLYSAIDPITGDSCHFLGFSRVDGLTTSQFLMSLQKQYSQTHNVIVWDQASFHQTKSLADIPDQTLISLPAYSPQLNPIERFFEELRRRTNNWVFEDIQHIEEKLEKAIRYFDQNRQKLISIVRYPYIKKQWEILSQN